MEDSEKKKLPTMPGRFDEIRRDIRERWPKAAMEDFYASIAEAIRCSLPDERLTEYWRDVNLRRSGGHLAKAVFLCVQQYSDSPETVHSRLCDCLGITNPVMAKSLESFELLDANAPADSELFGARPVDELIAQCEREITFARQNPDVGQSSFSLLARDIGKALKAFVDRSIP